MTAETRRLSRRGARAARAPAASPGARRVHGWLIACAALFAIALIWRLLYLQRLAATPLFGDLILDARDYWSWASALRAGGGAAGGAYFLGPLYPTWLCLLRSTFDDSIRAVLSVQAMLGALAAILIADAARRLTRPAIGLATGAIAALYGMAVFFDGLILMESLLWTLSALLLWWACAIEWPQARAWHFAALGGLIGLIAQGRAIACVLIAPALLLVPQWGARRALRPLAAMAAAFVVTAAPAALHNYRASGEWIPFTYNFGYNLYVGNNPEATGADVTVTGTQAHAAPPGASAIGAGAEDGREYLRATDRREFSPAQSSARWAAMARDYIAAHPLHAARLYLRKLAMLWSAHEYPQVENAAEYRRLAGPLGAPLFGTFGFVGALAFVGLARVRAAGRSGAFVLGSCIALSLAIAVFFVTDRYRHQLVPAALLIAALGMEAAVRAAAQSAAREPWIVAALLALGIIVTHLPVPHLSDIKSQWGLEDDIGRRWLAAGRADLALPHFERAAQLERSGRIGFEGGATGAIERMEFDLHYGSALLRVDRASEALPWLERAYALGPDNAGAITELAGAYRKLGRSADAERLDQKLGPLAGGAALGLEQQAFEAARAADFAAAESLFEATVARDPTRYGAWGALMRVQIQRGNLGAARATFAHARAAGLPPPANDAYQALLDALAGNRDAAQAALARVPRSALDADPSLAEVAVWARRVIAH